MHASRGLIALLVGTVLFLALWMVALKPHGSGSGGGAPTTGAAGYKADIAKAHQAVQTSAAGNARAGGAPVSASSQASAATGASRQATATHAAAGTTHAVSGSSRTAAAKSHTVTVSAAQRAGARNRFSEVQRAMRVHKAVAILFYNPAAADDQAVKQELAVVPTDRGRVVKLTIPLSEIANYTALTQQVPVNFSPTLVLVAPSGKAYEIVGFSDQFEIAKRVDQALAAR